MNKSEKFDILGVELEWKLTSAETAHKYCVLEATIPPGVVVPPHLHPDQEAFYVVEGAPEFATEGPRGLEWCFAVPGEVINAAPNTLHGYRNPTTSDVKLLITCTSNLGHFFEEAGLPIIVESPYRFAVPSAEQIGRVMDIGERFGHEYSSERPGNCTLNPNNRALDRLLAHPGQQNFNRAYLF